MLSRTERCFHVLRTEGQSMSLYIARNAETLYWYKLKVLLVRTEFEDSGVLRRYFSRAVIFVSDIGYDNQNGEQEKR